ncbi:MAG TPA: hypothetical protein VGF55_33435 [Gemmataceae bacterium]|jgi:hypothetical protein
MSRPHSLVLAILTAAAVPAVARADNPGPDLIPEDALVGVVVKNIDDLNAKAVKLTGELQVPLAMGLPTLIKSVTPLREGVDMKGSMGVVIPNLDKLGVKIHAPPEAGDNQALLDHIVLIFPVADADAIAANFGYKKGEWKLGTVKGHNFIVNDMKLLLTERFLYVSRTELAIVVLRGGKPLPGSLGQTQARALREADAVLHVGLVGLGDEVRRAALAEIDKTLLLGDPDDETVKQATAALQETRGVTVGVKIEDGLTLDFLLSFTKSDGAAAKFLTVLRGGPGTSDLNGLPAANPVAAYAAKGDGTRNVHQARALFKVLLKNAFGLNVALQGEDREKLLAAFDVLYKHLRGSRAAAYAVDPAKAAKFGRTAAVVILDLDDPAEHLSGWKNFIEVANKTSLKVNQGDAGRAPKFSFTPAAEQLDGMPVDVLAMDNPKLDPGDRAKNVQARGPDWNKIKMVTVGKQIVALFGSSDTDRLREAIRNVKEGNKGLAENPALAAQLKTLPAERKLELHGTGDVLAAFGVGGPANGPAGSWVSLALVVEPDRLQIRLRTPLAQMKALRP